MPAINFVPVIPGTHIHINNTYHVPRPDAEPVPTNLNPFQDWMTIAFLGIFILMGCTVWCFGPSNRSERTIRLMFKQDMEDEEKWRKQSIFSSGKKWHNIFVNLAFVFAWPMVAIVWLFAVMNQKHDDEQVRLHEEAWERARRVPMAGSEWGKCRMPLM